jgi:hypothetical protein
MMETGCTGLSLVVMMNWSGSIRSLCGQILLDNAKNLYSDNLRMTSSYTYGSYGLAASGLKGSKEYSSQPYHFHHHEKPELESKVYK